MMKHIRLNRKRAIITFALIVIATLALLPSADVEVNNPFGDGNTIGNFVKITIGPDDVYAAPSADFTCDGVDDNIQFTDAINALPATGGELEVLGGTYVFANLTSVTRAIDNVTITGVGRGSYFTGDGVTALFICGGNNWKFQDIRTDAGSITTGATTGWQMINVDLNGTLYSYRDSYTSIVGGTMTTTAINTGGKLTAGANEIEGSNFDINGGDVSAATISGGLTWASAQDLNAQALTNINIDSGDISGADVNVSGQTFTVGNTQIPDGVIIVSATTATDEWKDASQYVCDGILDDDTFIQAAIDAAAAEAYDAMVQLSPGLFNIVTAIEPKSGVWLNGCGISTQLKATGADNNVIATQAATSYTDITLSNFYVNGNKSQVGRTAGNGILIRGVTKGRYHGLDAKSCYDSGFVFDGSAGNPNGSSYITELRTESNTDYGLWLGDNSYGLSVDGYTGYANGTNLYAYYSQETRLNNLNLMQSTTADYHFLHCDNVLATNLYSSDATVDAFIFNDVINSSFVNLHAEDSNAGAGVGDAYSIVGGAGAETDHFTAIGWHTHTTSWTPVQGLYISGSANSVMNLTMLACDFLAAETPVVIASGVLDPSCVIRDVKGYVSDAELKPTVASILETLGTAASSIVVPANETSGTGISDYTKNVNNLTASPTLISWDTNPTFDNKLVLHNFNGTDEYMTRSDDTDFYVDDTGGSGPVTWFWAGNIDDTAAERGIMSVWDETNAAEKREWKITVDSNDKLRVDIFDETNNVGCYRLTDAAIDVGNFHVYSINYTGAGGAAAANGITIYEDGVVQASTATNNGAYVGMRDSGAPFYVGPYEDNGGSLTAYYDGQGCWFGMAKMTFTSYQHWNLQMKINALYN